MTWSDTTIENLRRVFHAGFTARDIAEPLVTVDAAAPMSDAAAAMDARNVGIVGVQRNGRMEGYLERQGLAGEGTCGDGMQILDASAIIPELSPLAETITALDKSPRLFVGTEDAVTGVVTIHDLGKPPVRMWLFGMVTLIEMRMHYMIEGFCGEEGWKQFVSEGRLKKAEEILAERRRRNQNPRLLDCLQFADQAGIIARNEAIRSLTRFTSRSQVEQAAKALESLRNNLAHSQDIVSTDWNMIVTLSSEFDSIISRAKLIDQTIGNTTT